MSISLAQIKKTLLYDFKSGHELNKAIEEVGHIFNHMRENIKDYHHDNRLISAYVAYYLTTNYPKFKSVIDMVRIDLSHYEHIVDIGTGPGTFLLAAANLNSSLGLHGIDHSEHMLTQAQKILSKLHPQREITLSKKLIKPNGKTLYLFSHSLNEMTKTQALDYLNLIEDEDILLIEPGTRESFQKVLALREEVIRKKYRVHFPCSTESNCPMNTENDWCHQYIFVNHANDVEIMTQKLGRNRRLLPLCVQFYSKTQKPKSTKAMLVRVLRPTKHSLEWVVCQDDNHLINLEIPLKQFSKKEAKLMQKVTAGHNVDYELIKELPEKKRVKLLSVDALPRNL